jgi:pantothenate synthetase
LSDLGEDRAVVAVLAARLGSTRLIDNEILHNGTGD